MTYAQDATDDWIAEQFPAGFVGSACELGACDGVSISNTLLLEQHGWMVLCIEPNADYELALRLNRRDVMICACGAVAVPSATLYVNTGNPEAYSGLRPAQGPGHPSIAEVVWSLQSVEVRTLSQCLEAAKFATLDVLSVDTEGTELDVLRGLDFARWLPKVIVAESWSADTPITPWLGERGYALAGRRGDNNLYLKDSAP